MVCNNGPYMFVIHVITSYYNVIINLVHNLENEEVIGYLTIVIEGLDSLRQIQNS